MVTVVGFLTFAVAFGVTATNNVRVPAFKPFTVDFDIEQIFFDVLTTVSTTLAPRISVTGRHKMGTRCGKPCHKLARPSPTRNEMKSDEKRPKPLSGRGFTRCAGRRLHEQSRAAEFQKCPQRWCESLHHGASARLGIRVCSHSHQESELLLQ